MTSVCEWNLGQNDYIFQLIAGRNQVKKLVQNLDIHNSTVFGFSPVKYLWSL